MMSREERRLYNQKYRQSHPEYRENQHQYMKKYRRSHKEKIREYNKEYYQLHPELKEKKRQYQQRLGIKERTRKYSQRSEIKEKHRLHVREYCQRYPELIKKRHQRYRQSLRGKLVIARHDAKRQTRGFIPLWSTPWPCPVDYHHIAPNSPYVVPIPHEIHQAVMGKLHFVFNEAMITQLYGLNFDEDLKCLE